MREKIIKILYNYSNLNWSKNRFLLEDSFEQVAKEIIKLIKNKK